MAERPSYTIRATTKVLERVYYALQRCEKNPDLSAKAINAEIKAKFGAPLANAVWTTINAARHAGHLNRVSTRVFDFARHGRVARQGKSQLAASAPERAHSKRGAHASAADPASNADKPTYYRPNRGKHPNWLVAATAGNRRDYRGCRTRKAAEREMRRLLREGSALGDIAVYRVEPVDLRLNLR